MRKIKTERLDAIKARYEELSNLIADPEVIADTKQWTKFCKEHSDLEPVYIKYNELIKCERDFESASEIAHNDTDAEMSALAKEEAAELDALSDKIVADLKIMLLPQDPMDGKNAIIEIRPAAGGEEAALFAAQLMRMYKMYAERMRWSYEDIDINDTELGGIKEAVFSVSGASVFSLLKYESGVHRVQRVPDTESQGRVHTSTVTVAVLPEAEDIEVDLNEKDIKIDTYRSSGAGGQHINKTDSAIRMTHLPTGIVVTCQDQRSQTKNRDKAMQVLKSKLYDYYQTRADSEYAKNRHDQVGTGDRSERIRTYNFPQGRVTDHRIGYTLYSIDSFMNGELDSMIEALRLADQTKRLENQGE